MTPLVTAINGSVFGIPEACMVDITVLGAKLRGLCGVLESLPTDVLLGNDLLKTKLNFQLIMRNLP